MNITQGQIWQVVTDGLWSTGSNGWKNGRKCKIKLKKDEFIEIRYAFKWHVRTTDNEYVHLEPKDILKNCRYYGKIDEDVKFKNKHNLAQILEQELFIPVWEEVQNES